MRRRLRPVALLAAALLVAACSASEPTQVPPDDRFGHRYAGPIAPDGRLTVVPSPPARGRDYFYYPAPFDSLHVRPAAFAAAGGEVPRTQVEVLVKGTFPDTCTELHEVEQRRAGHIVELDLVMRRAEGAVCRRALRPWRLYVPLGGSFRPGDYVLKVNRFNYTFTLRRP